MSFRSLFIALILGLFGISVSTAGPDVQIAWDQKTLRLIEPGGVYGRMILLGTSNMLCGFEKGGQVWTRYSSNKGATWGNALQATHYAYGNAANPELLRLRSGKILLLYNERPSDGLHPYTIRMASSTNMGRTWQFLAAPVYQADTLFQNGCWEPAAIQQEDGLVRLFFANENPYRQSDEQEITQMQSSDEGQRWGQPETYSFRSGHRDGLPAPLLLLDRQGMAVAIEDNGLTPDGQFKPAICFTSWQNPGTTPIIDGSSTNRWSAVSATWPDRSYAGAPGLRQLPTGETLLSCQSNEKRGQPQMVVYVGDAHAQNFTNRSVPFIIATNVSGLWNSMCVVDANTVTALSTTTINGTQGLWAVVGHIVRSGQPARSDLRVTSMIAQAGLDITIDGDLHYPQRLQYSSDLQTWMDLSLLSGTQPSITYLDSAVRQNPQRFYRTVFP